VYDPEADGDENAAEMVDAAESVVTGEITQAVRDTTTSIGAISTGEWIGLNRGEGIVAKGDTVVDAAIALLDEIVGHDAELITIITGLDADAATTASIEGWLTDHHGNVAREVQYGGQPLYPYLFGVE
jgi:uncharacterized protein